MSEPNIPSLGDTELEVLNVVWDRGESTVGQVHEVISGRREVAYTTIMTVMKNLARKGYLSYSMRGRSYLYWSERTAGDVRSGLLRDLVQRAFGDSPLTLALTLVREESLSARELDDLKEAIRRLEDGDTDHE
jgi:predicted transcriptional regulator